MNALKWVLIAFAVGLLVGAGIVLFALYRPASATITDLRKQSDRAAEQYRAELDSYTGLLAEARGRAGELESDLARAAEEHRADVERVERLEDQARSLQKLIGEIQDSGGRASEHNRAIRGEAEAALGELREYRAAIESSPGDSGERDPPAED